MSLSPHIDMLRPYFFLILGLRIFFQNIKVGGGKKIKIKITKKNFFLFNLKHIWIGGKKKKKNCMILHCKNAEMAIYCHFCIFTVQDHTKNFIFSFFLNLAVFYIGGNKKIQK